LVKPDEIRIARSCVRDILERSPEAGYSPIELNLLAYDSVCADLLRAAKELVLLCSAMTVSKLISLTPVQRAALEDRIARGQAAIRNAEGS
jgi:hypothetical protein